MHEMVLVSAVIVLTLLVMGGLLIVFRKWLAVREDLVNRAWATAEREVSRSHEDSASGKPPRKRRNAAVA